MIAVCRQYFCLGIPLRFFRQPGVITPLVSFDTFHCFSVVVCVLIFFTIFVRGFVSRRAVCSVPALVWPVCIM